MEVAFRFLLPDGKLAKGAYHSGEFRFQVEQYQQSIPVNMMIIGSSVAAANVPPEHLDARLHELGMEDFTSYNAGIRGCNFDCIATGIRRHYWAEYQPPFVLAVISPIDLDIDNTGVIARSKRFAADMERSFIARGARQLLANASVLYGFKEEIRQWLTSGKWEFDEAIPRTRGYIDMGSTILPSAPAAPVIVPDSEIVRDLVSLIEEIAASGSHVILLPVEGNSLARLVIPDDARGQYWSLMKELTLLPNVNMLEADSQPIDDDAYFDTVHLKTQAAAENASRLAERLVESGLLSGP